MRLQGSLHLKAELIIQYYFMQAHNEQKGSQMLFVTKINKKYTADGRSPLWQLQHKQ